MTGTEDAIRDNYRRQRQAMLAADADALGALLAPDFTLTHMTGYRQSRSEWLAQVESGEMAYHAIQDVETTVDLSEDHPVLTARTRTEATIWGTHGTWPLLLEIHYGSDALATHTEASTW